MRRALQVEEHMRVALGVVTRLLSLKSDSGVATKTRLAAHLAAAEGRRPALEATSAAIAVLAFCSSVTVLQVPRRRCCPSGRLSASVHLPA